MLRYRQSHRAFTIVELLIVIVVISVLAKITIVAYNGIQNRATVTLLTSKLSMAAKALEADRVINGVYPDSLTTANNGAGIAVDQGVTLDYQYDNTGPVPTYCLTAYNDNIAYVITSSTPSASEGACAGSTAGGLYVPLTNLVSNGDFSGGTTGWLTSNAGTVTLVDNAATFTPIGNPTSTTGTHHIYKSVALVTGQVYYLRSDVYGKARMALTTYSYPSNTTNTWGTYIARQVATITGVRAFGVRSKLTSAWEQIQCKNLLIINLTTAFGAGNEPTVAQMDAIMQQFPNQWFDGTASAKVSGL
ncbi:prepilin-type N-terminal cleavage/methylation domain-containing protein [Candidatus Saccharibacteria bacterium]|nr:prepilin-type N-terminal cleavage/methylation domain-containing protein [Candidatus Saccharibacteria bacterium]